MSIEITNSTNLAKNFRILCLLPSIPLGGMERAVARLVQKLMVVGAEVNFVLDKRWGIPVQDHIETIGGQWTGVEMVAKLGLPQTFLEWRWAIRSFLRTSADFERASHVFNPCQLLATNLNNAYFARGVARRDNIRSVFRLPNPPGISTSSIKRSIDKAIWQSVYQSFDVLVCNSQYTAGRLVDVVGDEQKIRVIRNFLPNLSRPVDSRAPTLEKDRLTIVYIGQISRQKGVEILIDAIEDIITARDDVDLVLAGADVWKDSFSDDIRARVNNAGLSQRIRFLGHVDDIQGLLRQADIHVCPSISAGDSFPNVVLDAKQAGLPSVVFPTAGLPEAVTNDVDGIVTQSCSKAELATSIRRLIDDDLFRESLADGAIKSLSAYSDKKLTDDWIRVFSV